MFVSLESSVLYPKAGSLAAVLLLFSPSTTKGPRLRQFSQGHDAMMTWCIWTSLQETGTCTAIIPAVSAKGDGTDADSNLAGVVFHLSSCLGLRLPSSSHFPFCYSNNFIFISSSASEVLCVYAKSMFGILVETEVKIEVHVSTLTSSLPYLDDSLLFSLSLCWESFFFLSHASLLPRKSQS